MEHISRNTQSERIAYLIGKIRDQNNKVIEREFDKLTDSFSGVCTGILSAVLAESCVSFFRFEKIYVNLLLFACMFFLVWLLSWGILYCVKKKNKNLFDTKEATHEEILDIFNFDIMQKVSEINEEMGIALETESEECQVLNFIVSFNKWRQVVLFASDYFCHLNPEEVRDVGTTILVESQDKYFNAYSISAVLLVMDSINKRFKILLGAPAIKKISGYELMVSDYDELSNKFYKVKTENGK